MNEVLFSPEILRSQTTLAQFFSGDKEMQEIIQAGRDPSRLAGRWQVSSFAEELAWDFYYSLRIVILSIGKCVLNCFCLSDLSKRITVQISHEENASTTLKTARYFKANFLARSINDHQMGTEDIYLQPPLKVSFPGQTESLNLEFFRGGKGVCRGECFWFLYLYLKTARYFTDTATHLKAVGSQFEKGASRQAALLHSLTYVDYLYPLLGFTMQEEYRMISMSDKTKEQAVCEIQALDPGIYFIYTGQHQLIYIKRSPDQQFLYDPNKGVLKVEALHLFQKVIDGYINYPRILIDKCLVP